MSAELYKKYRPKNFNEVVGQDSAIRTLVDMGKTGRIPHAILFTGPSGTGKTTLARILKEKLKCSDGDFIEMNSASDARGIDTIRMIQRQMSSAALGGKCRIWLLDECHQFSTDAQEGFLKILEDQPPHVYFFLATTNPTKLKKTIITRCTEIRCGELSDGDLIKLVSTVSEKEGKPIDEEVAKKIASVSEGSARKALVLLHSLIGLDGKDEQLSVLESASVQEEAIQIARKLLSEKTTWAEMRELLQNVKEAKQNAEGIRHLVLAYCNTVLLKSGNSRAAAIAEEFRDPWYNCQEVGLTLSCYNIVTGG